MANPLRQAAALLLAVAMFAVGCGATTESSVDAPSAVVPSTATPETGVAPVTEASPPAVPPEGPTAVPAAVPTTPPVATTAPTPTTAPPTPTAAPTVAVEADHECRFENAAPGPAGATPLRTEIIATGLEVPWGLAALPDGDLLLTERPGRVRLIEDGVLVAEPVLEPDVDLPPPLFGIDRLGPEGGLLGLVLHPDFAANRLFYIFYNSTDADGTFIGRVERHRLADDGRSATFDTLILDDLPAGVHHQGGRMAIGPDGQLYVGVGAFDPPEAQDPTTLAGKLLRLDLDGNIPADNPDPASPIFISGVRNTQGYDWIDADTLVMVDHGPSGLELDMPDLTGLDEVNIVRGGENLGWPRVWGCDGAADLSDGLVHPILTWAESVPPTGATVVRGDRIAGWQNSVLFTVVGGTARGQHLHRVVLDPEDPYTVVGHETYLRGEFGRLRTVVEAPDGSLYVMTSNCDGRGVCPPQGDVVIRITAG